MREREQLRKESARYEPRNLELVQQENCRRVSHINLSAVVCVEHASEKPEASKARRSARKECGVADSRNAKERAQTARSVNGR